MPYGYYQLTRIVSFVLSGYFAYVAFSKKKIFMLVIFLIAGLLFNPIVKVVLGKQIWQIVDFIYAATVSYTHLDVYKRQVIILLLASTLT